MATHRNLQSDIAGRENAGIETGDFVTYQQGDGTGWWLPGVERFTLGSDLETDNSKILMPQLGQQREGIDCVGPGNSLFSSQGCFGEPLVISAPGFSLMRVAGGPNQVETVDCQSVSRPKDTPHVVETPEIN